MTEQMTAADYASWRINTMSEDELLRNVLDLAKALHLRTAHFRPARTEHGWRTAVAGDGAGFPDLVIVGASGVLYRELKSHKGIASTDQCDWIVELRRAGCNAEVWRPIDWFSGAIRAQLEAITRP